MYNPIDVGSVGQDKSNKEVVDAYDSAHGKYENKVEKVPMEERLQESQMPKAADPSPFALGPMTPGGRK